MWSALVVFLGLLQFLGTPVSAENTNNLSRIRKSIQNTTYGPLLAPNCGFSDTEHNRVVGGLPAELGAYPWISLLGYRSRNNRNVPVWLCGGTLISARHVVTAAHCVYQRDDLYIVRVGDLNLYSTRDGAHPIDALIERKSVHPKYNPKTFTNDVAVIRLQRDIPFSRNIHPICLPVPDQIRNKNLVGTYPFVAGWGATYYEGPPSAQLLETQVPVVSREQCYKAYQGFSNAVIDDNIICAGYASGGKDTCQGDSGGPMMTPQKNTYYLVGIVSYGYKCGEPGFPGVYTRVTAFLDYITSELV